MLLWSFPILFCTFEFCSSVSNFTTVIFHLLFAFDFYNSLLAFIIRLRIILFTFEFCYLLSNSVLSRIMFSASTIIFILYLRIVLFLGVFRKLGRNGLGRVINYAYYSRGKKIYASLCKAARWRKAAVLVVRLVRLVRER